MQPNEWTAFIGAYGFGEKNSLTLFEQGPVVRFFGVLGYGAQY